MWDDVLLSIIIGFVAQMIDGAIGMAYGVTASFLVMTEGGDGTSIQPGFT